MYNYRLFNDQDYFLRFNSWYESIILRFHEEREGLKIADLNDISKEYKKIKSEFHSILVHANYIISNLNQLHVLERIIIDQFEQLRDDMDLREERIVIYSPHVIDLLGKISMVLNSISFIQNRIPRILSKELKKSLPASLEQFIKGNNIKYRVENKYFQIVRRYWVKTGKRIKKYRDVEQHHFILTTDVFLSSNPKFNLLVMLPDNPEVKQPEKLTYVKEYNAILYMEQSFENLHSCIEDLAREFGHNPKKFSASINLDSTRDLINKSGTIAAMIDNLEFMSGIIFGNDKGRIVLKPFHLKKKSFNL